MNATEHPLPRRTVLRAGAAAAAGLSLAACSSRNEPQQPQRKSNVVVKKSDVPVGGGYIVPDANFVVTQPTQGQFKAFVKICPHAGCAVSSVEGGKIHCPCHGSNFAVADGHVLNGPATGSLGPATVTDNGDTLEVSG